MDELLKLALRAGIIPRPGTTGVMNDRTMAKIRQALANDAEPTLAPNNSIPQYLLNVFNPEIIKVMLAPLTAELIFGAVKRGTWESETTTFIMSELFGDIDTYGDFSHDGAVDADYNFPHRQAYRFQTTMRLGDLESAQWGEAKINALADKELAMAEIMKRAHNRIWFYGVEGLENFGLLNNPEAADSIQPLPAGGTVGNPTEWPEKSALDLFHDIKALKGALNRQSFGNIPDNAELKLVYSTNRAEEFLKTNEFGISVVDRLKKAFPRMDFIESPEYSTAAGEIIQLIAPSLNGRRTGDLGYAEMLRSHGVVRAKSSIEEKKSASNWGAVIYYPMAIATMVGI